MLELQHFSVQLQPCNRSSDTEGASHSFKDVEHSGWNCPTWHTTYLFFIPIQKKSIFPAFPNTWHNSAVYFCLFVLYNCHISASSFWNQQSWFVCSRSGHFLLAQFPQSDHPTSVSCTCPEVQLPWGKHLVSSSPHNQILFTCVETNTKLTLS